MQTENDGRNDFDFLVGNWKMRHRRLKERLKGSTEWEEFEGRFTSHSSTEILLIRFFSRNPIKARIRPQWFPCAFSPHQ